jgi:hypothetical protein
MGSYQPGQDFRPPPDWGSLRWEAGSQGFQDLGDIDLFDLLAVSTVVGHVVLVATRVPHAGSGLRSPCSSAAG